MLLLILLNLKICKSRVFDRSPERHDMNKNYGGKIYDYGNIDYNYGESHYETEGNFGNKDYIDKNYGEPDNIIDNYGNYNGRNEGEPDYEVGKNGGEPERTSFWEVEYLPHVTWDTCFSCRGMCGRSEVQCSCEANCQLYRDCCYDFEEVLDNFYVYNSSNLD